jgi:hypothetical protein
VDGKFLESIDGHVEYVGSRGAGKRLHMGGLSPIQGLQPKIFQGE